MIDTRLLLDDFDATVKRLERKGVARALLEEARDLALGRRQAVTAVDEARRELNAGSSEVGRLMREGRREEAESRRVGLAEARSRADALDAERRDIEERLDDVVRRIPNLPDDAVPDGRGEEDNRVVITNGYDPDDYAGREWRPHWDVAADLGLFDAERAAKLSGAMFSVLRGDGARLLRGLVDFGLDLHRHRYEEIVVPHMVRTEVIDRTGHLTKFDTQAYRVRDDELWLLPTAEVALMGLYQGEILDEATLPRR
ncbi:MAG TPA: serine--tRNA ligase, partial [Acidimicrobiales bacterium]|nr:serine--tRNA ligase [Acidimicrobiales bacterium]